MARPLRRDIAALIGAGAVVLGTAAAAAVLWDWKAERDCHAAGNQWSGFGSCLQRREYCVHGGLAVAVGAKFFDGCNSCECTPYAMRCTSRYCPGASARVKPCDSECGACAYELGCNSPRNFCVAWTHDAKQTYCSCEGLTFEATVPTKPFRHLGACE